MEFVAVVLINSSRETNIAVGRILSNVFNSVAWYQDECVVVERLIVIELVSW